MRWQLPLIVTYSITTHKSQSMTAHNGIVYEPYVVISRATDLRTDHFITDKFKAENDTNTTFYKNLKSKFNTDEEK